MAVGEAIAHAPRAQWPGLVVVDGSVPSSDGGPDERWPARARCAGLNEPALLLMVGESLRWMCRGKGAGATEGGGEGRGVGEIDGCEVKLKSSRSFGVDGICSR
jgi:hypothetical protein